MGSELVISSKRRYDISMSKRTRKPWNLKPTDENIIKVLSLQATVMDSAAAEVDKGKAEADKEEEDEEEEEEGIDGKSLKQLINGDEDDEKKNRSSLEQHFKQDQDKNLQLIKRQQNDGDRVKLKGMMSRYVKV
ncbi:uncharacterized protein LOC110809020 isoform X2 [Carica papaya]|nr:uncharacterized protein LOC110809020 isoform X2 [Carica papaya]